MPKAFLKTKNRGGHKTYQCGVCREPIVAGEEYFTWKPNRGVRGFQHARHGHPRRSALNSGSKMVELWDAVDTFDVSAAESPDDIKLALAAVAEAAESVAAQYTESADNIEEHWPSGNTTSEACRATAEALEGWAQELEAWEPDEAEWVDGESQYLDAEEWLEAMRTEASDLMGEQPEYQG